MGASFFRRLDGAAVCALVLAAAGAARAADADPGPIATGASRTVDELVVQTQRDALRRPLQTDKTGTALQDLPASVQVITGQVLSDQGVTMLRDSLSNASGVNVGGQDTKGFYDHFLIRGLNAQVFEDGFSDGDELGGISHSLNGVDRIEVLEGPGSALFGSGPPGGTINIIHQAPSADLHYGFSVQGGSFGTISNSDYVTGPTGITDLNYLADATFSRSDGFRGLKNDDDEVRPSLEWQLGAHRVDVAVDLRRIDETPDSYGLIYFHGSPIDAVSLDSKYSTPFAFAHSDFVRPTVQDAWTVSDALTINNRLSYTYRTLDSLGNGDSASTAVVNGQVVDRQLRRQDDTDNSLDYQLEPVWRFATGDIHHTLLTGFEYQHLTIATARMTADLPNIPDAFAPVPPETSARNLDFLCDAKHSCDNDHLSADYFSLYATDQVDVTDKLKVRAGVRQDWFDTALTPQTSVPGAFGGDGRPLLAGVEDRRDDAMVSWNAGALYKVLPWLSPYVGVSKSYLSNFNSENAQAGVAAPESALQYEGGVKFSFLDDRISLTTAGFSISRDNVAATTTLDGLETVVFDSQRTRGGEAALNALLTDRWRLLANVTVQDPVITNNPQGVASVGHRPQGAPTDIANLWTTYDFAIGGVSGFRVGGGVNYQSRTFSDITNASSIPASVVANALVGYETPRWGVDVNVRNLANQRYFIAANGAGALVGEPLSALARVHLNY